MYSSLSLGSNVVSILIYTFIAKYIYVLICLTVYMLYIPYDINPCRQNLWIIDLCLLRKTRGAERKANVSIVMTKRITCVSQLISTPLFSNSRYKKKWYSCFYFIQPLYKYTYHLFPQLCITLQIFSFIQDSNFLLFLPSYLTFLWFMTDILQKAKFFWKIINGKNYFHYINSNEKFKKIVFLP